MGKTADSKDLIRRKTAKIDEFEQKAKVTKTQEQKGIGASRKRKNCTRTVCGKTNGKRRYNKMSENEKAKNEVNVSSNTSGNNGFTFEIVEHICVLGKGREEGYTKELNYVSFRGMQPKWDVREWNREHTRMTKGITFTWDEMRTLIEAMIEKADMTEEAC